MKKVVLLFVLFLGLTSAYSYAQDSYELGIGDKINIAVFEEPDMSFELVINDSGIFAYPYIGDIQLIGKSTAQLEDELVNNLIGDVLVKPNVSVTVIEYRPFSIGGEVKNPGNYAYEPNLTIKKAINLAGGVTDWSNGRRFRIERAKIIPGEKLNQDTLVYPGDTVTVLPRRF